MKSGIARAAAVALCVAMAAVRTHPARAASDAPAMPPSIAPLVAPDLRWTLRLPSEDKVVYHGVVSYDGAGVGSLYMLYPAPLAVGLIAVLIHGLTNETSKKAQKDKMQDAADMVLLPYQAVLNGYTYRELMQRGLERTATGSTRALVEFSQLPGTELFVESTPVFAMTQDQSALIVENVVAIYSPGATPPAAYRNLVKVVSSEKAAPDLIVFWTADNGRNIKEESAAILAESLDIALRDAMGGPDKGGGADRTIRYREGGAERMERGQQISGRCNRIVIRTLRGGLMSVPIGNMAAAGEGAQACDDATVVAK